MNAIYSSRNLCFWGGLLSLAILVFSGCKKDAPSEVHTSSQPAANYNAAVPRDWMELFLDIDRFSPGYRPPAAARLLAYTNLAAYEAAVSGMPEFNSMRYQFGGLTLPVIDNNLEYHWPSAVNAAYASCFRFFYPHISQSYRQQITTLENRFLTQFRQVASEEVLNRSASYGRAVAEAVQNWSITDVYGHEAYLNPRPSSYSPPEFGPGGEHLWQPTFPDFTRGLFPYWGNVRTFSLRPSDRIARPPLVWSADPNSAFHNQAKEVYIWVKNATFEDRWIAEFWSDDIFELTFEPAGRLIAVAQQLLVEDNLTLAEAVEMYAKLGLALSDVGVAIWHSKYLYNVERPISYIRRHIDPEWRTILNNPLANVQGMTPEFPAYPSGHSGFGSAGSAVIADFFGNVRPFTDRCHENRTEFIGTPRSYNTILETGVENAYSRLPLGVHYRMDCDEGIRMGYLVARRVLELPWRK
jgi:membrane-associated phospholipid phosphatase